MPGYFRTVGTPMRAGRDFTALDRFDAPAVVIVNQFLAEAYWPGENPVGKRLRITLGQDAEWRDVVGVVKNGVRSWWADQPEEEVFLPVLQSRLLRDTMGAHASYLTFVLRSDGDPAAIVPSARAAVRTLSPAVPISEVWLMRDAAAAALDDSRFTLVLLVSFAVSALVLAAIGVYGVMSHAVADRRRELGIRLALGATPASVAGRLVLEGLTVACAGAAVGLAIAAIGGNAIATLLFGVTPFDPLTFVAVAVALVAVATVACLIPARRASRIEPQRELR
jgi:putative ABC transport system permease protein